MKKFRFNMLILTMLALLINQSLQTGLVISPQSLKRHIVDENENEGKKSFKKLGQLDYVVSLHGQPNFNQEETYQVIFPSQNNLDGCQLFSNQITNPNYKLAVLVEEGGDCTNHYKASNAFKVKNSRLIF